MHCSPAPPPRGGSSMTDARAALRPSKQAMTHSRAVFLMVLVTLLWSIAGVVTRHLEAARAFEITFWRSAFTVLALSVGLSALRGAAWWHDVRRARWPLWASGVCWSVMF